MAYNPPLPGNFGDSFLKGLDSGSLLIARMLQPKLKREEMAQQAAQFAEKLQMQKANQSRMAEAAHDAHKLAMMKLDPNYEVNQLKRMMEAFGGKQMPTEQESFVPSIPMGGNENPMGQVPSQDRAMPSINENALTPFDAANNNNIDMEAIKNSPILRGYFKKHFGMDLGAETNRPYQGAARNAMDLERLRKEVGEDSNVYQNAKSEYDANIQNKKDLDLMRNRTISGLKSGERWISDPATGENVGIEHNLTEKERDREIGRTFFNELYPLVYKGSAPFSGEGSIRRLEDVASKYNSNPEARQRFDDYLLAEKLLTATTVNEAATLNSGKTNQTYRQLRESLDSSDVPKKIGSLIKQYQIPASAQLKAAMRFQKIINEAQDKANKMTPATRKLYFNPEKQEASQANNEEPVSTNTVIVVDPTGKRFETSEENAAHLPSGWKRG